MKVLHISDNGVELILWKTQTKFLDVQNIQQ
jgi:hypothetical protein